MRIILATRIQEEGLSFDDSGMIIDKNGVEYDAVSSNGYEVYTPYAVYYGFTDQITSATRLDSKENGYRRETLYRTPKGDFANVIELVNISGLIIEKLPYEHVVEWYQVGLPEPPLMWPGATVGSVFGAPRLYAPRGYSIIVVSRRLGQTFVVNAYPPQADLLVFTEPNSTTVDLSVEDTKLVGWCTRQEFVSHHEQVDLGYWIVRAIRDQHLNRMCDIPIPPRDYLFH